MPAEGSVVLNEIMPHTNNLWNDEWVELYNPTNQTIIFNGSVGDEQSNDSINLVIYNKSFALIVDSNTGFGNSTGCGSFDIPPESCVELTAIGNGLNDGGDNLILYDNSGQLVDNYTWSGQLENNISFGRYPDGSMWDENLIPTPGYANQIPVISENVKLSVYLESPALEGVEYDKLFKIEIENKENCSIKDKVSVWYNITNSTTLIKSDGFTREVGCSGYANTGTWTPDTAGDFTICGFITNSTVNESDFTDNFACKNITVVANPVAIISIPKKTTFGSFNLVYLRFNATHYKYDKARFLIYGKSARVVTDLRWNKIKSYAECQGETAVEINGTTNHTLLVIPFFIYPNCDSYYSAGDYDLILRVCKPVGSKFDRWIEIPFDLSIDGKNPALCPEPEIRTKTVYRIITKSEKLDEQYQILSAPLSVHVGEEFEVAVKLINSADKSKGFLIYSYVLKGRELVSEGLANGRWSGAWTANKKDISVAPGEEKTITLLNRIKAGTEPGNYKLKVRIKGEKDLIRNITVLPPLPEIKAELSCERINDTVRLEIKNLGPAANFSVMSFPRPRIHHTEIGQNSTEELDLDGEAFLLINNDKILAKCSVAKKLKKEIGQSWITGHFIKRSAKGVWNWILTITSWIRSMLWA